MIKEYLTPKQAAEYLSQKSEETFDVQDIFLLGRDRRINILVRFTGYLGRIFKAPDGSYISFEGWTIDGYIYRLRIAEMLQKGEKGEINLLGRYLVYSNNTSDKEARENLKEWNKFWYASTDRSVEFTDLDSPSRTDTTPTINLDNAVFVHISDLDNLIIENKGETLKNENKINYLEDLDEEKKPVGISRTKADTIAAARFYALHLWREREKKGEEVKIGDVVQNVYSWLHGTAIHDNLPERPERIREWIKPIAPKYARTGGRPKKTS